MEISKNLYQLYNNTIRKLLKKYCLYTFVLSFAFLASYAQPTSKHTITQYLNHKEIIFPEMKIFILVDSTKITAKQEGLFYIFPLIDTTKTVTVIIEVNKKEFISIQCKAWWINNGSRMSIGKLTRINKLLSIAMYNDIEKSDENWNIFSKRFFLADGGTIDIENLKKIKELNYLRINPNNSKTAILTQKIIRFR